MNIRGFTLLEAVVALGLLLLVTLALLPAFLTQMDAGTHSATQSEAVTASQQVLEALRLEEISTLPSTGSASPETVTVGQADYEVTTHFCVRSEFCDGTTRHLVVEVKHEGTKVYDVETVFTEF
ncbi:MAG: hypothetical protein GY716_23265 [bacterium]|nr:hypothetical protein [bacterium]